MIELETLPRETLIKLVKMYSRNWQTLDGLWFSNVEAACGLDTAVKIDLQNWGKQAAIEAKRIKAALGIDYGGIPAILAVLSYMSWQLTSPLFECHSQGPTRAVISYRQCAVQEGRARLNKPPFPCRQMKLTLLGSIARVAEPRARVRCLACPPDAPHPEGWCRWELSMD